MLSKLLFQPAFAVNCWSQHSHTASINAVDPAAATATAVPAFRPQQALSCQAADAITGKPATHATQAGPSTAVQLAMGATVLTAAGRHGFRRFGGQKRRTRCAAVMEESEDENTQHLRLLAEWLQARGTTVSEKIGIVEDDGTGGGRGLAAVEAFIEDEVVLELPLSCCFSAAPGLQAQLVSALPALAEADVVGEDVALAVAMATERSLGQNSAWWPYIQSVGQPNLTFPCFYADGDLEALQSVPLAKSFEALSRGLDKLASCTAIDRSALAAALQLVMTRRFGCEQGRFMLPIGDLLNHDFYPTCVWDKPTPERQTWRLKAGRGGMQPNEPITFCYCSDPNHLLMRTVGFVVPGNPFNRIMVKPCELRECLAAASAEGPGAAAPEEFSKWRQEQIAENLQDPEEDGPGMSMFFIGRSGGGTQWNPLWLNLCGLAMATSKDGDHWSRRPGGVDEYFGVLKNASWHMFDTTLEEDQEAIKAESLSENRQLALAFRIQQKEVLTEALDGFYKQLTDAQAKAAAA